MNIYHFGDDGFYTHQSTLTDSDRDPLNHSQFLIPSGATDQPPVEMAVNQAAHWSGDGWAVVPDIVGTVYYIAAATFTITERGVDIPRGASLVKPDSLIAKELEDYKAGKTKFISAIASSYQSKVVGTADPAQEARYAQNVAAAARIIANTADEHDRAMLQEQLDACTLANKKDIAGKSLLEFATWIDEQWKLIRRANGAIEAIKVRGIAQIMQAKSKAGVDDVLAQLEQDAEARYQQLLTTGQ